MFDKSRFGEIEQYIKVRRNFFACTFICTFSVNEIWYILLYTHAPISLSTAFPNSISLEMTNTILSHDHGILTPVGICIENYMDQDRISFTYRNNSDTHTRAQWDLETGTNANTFALVYITVEEIAYNSDYKQ